jgi:hypothetical protein
MTVASNIVILEDNAERQAIMRACLEEHFAAFASRFFDDAAEMIHFLDANLAETIAIALDNDLEMKTGRDGRCVDPGEGRQVAEFLAGRAPVCPVVIHTTNANAADAMTEVLTTAGWKTRRVVPFDDMNWIATDWFAAMRRAIVGPIKRTRSGSAS